MTRARRKVEAEVVVVDRRDGISAEEASIAGAVLREWQKTPDPAPEPPPLPYVVGQWRHLPNYRCRRCAYETLDLNAMEAHLRSHEEGSRWQD